MRMCSAISKTSPRVRIQNEDCLSSQTAEVSFCNITAVSTTIGGFLRVFTLQAAEGKLFGPLDYTKFILHWFQHDFLTFDQCQPYSSLDFFSLKSAGKQRSPFSICIGDLGHRCLFTVWLGSWVLCAFGIANLANQYYPERIGSIKIHWVGITVIAISWLLPSMASARCIYSL